MNVKEDLRANLSAIISEIDILISGKQQVLQTYFYSTLYLFLFA